MIHFLLPAGLDWTLRDYLSHRGQGVADRFRILEYESLPCRTAFDPGTYVLVAFERLTAAMRRAVEELHRCLSVAEGFGFLNTPTRTLLRLELLDALWRADRNDFRAARATEDWSGLRYPVFLRSERSHDGALSPLLKSRREVDAAIGRALLYGRALGDLLLVEFCDTADADGRYRKYSAFIVGKQVLPRNLEVARHWVVKDDAREYSRTALLEERDYVFGNPHERELADIFALAGVGYGRIDYAIKDGRLQTWEINSHPTIGPTPHPTRNPVPADLQPISEESKRHFYRGFEAAWKAVDRTSEGHVAVSVALPSVPLAPEVARERRLRRLPKVARRALRPLRSALEPLAAPLLGRLARQRRTR